MRKKSNPGDLRLKPKNITALNFKKYGCLIQWVGPEKEQSNNQFCIVLRDSKAIGWRIAYLIVREKQIKFLEQHPLSFESFEPVKGKAILYVSNEKIPQTIEAFVLDKPIILLKGIWHNVLSLTKETHIKITENNKVKLIRHILPQTIKS